MADASATVTTVSRQTNAEEKSLCPMTLPRFSQAPQRSVGTNDSKPGAACTSPNE
jgi:hypothetical protein